MNLNSLPFCENYSGYLLFGCYLDLYSILKSIIYLKMYLASMNVFVNLLNPSGHGAYVIANTHCSYVSCQMMVLFEASTASRPGLPLKSNQMFHSFSFNVLS